MAQVERVGAERDALKVKQKRQQKALSAATEVLPDSFVGCHVSSLSSPAGTAKLPDYFQARRQLPQAVLQRGSRLVHTKRICPRSDVHAQCSARLHLAPLWLLLQAVLQHSIACSEKVSYSVVFLLSLLCSGHFIVIFFFFSSLSSAQ